VIFIPPQNKARRKRRVTKDDVVLPVQISVALLTTANGAAVTGDILDNVDDLKVYSSLLTWAIRSHTAGEGPIDVGIADADYTDAEIVEALDASPTGRSDKIALERASRKVYLIGTFNGEGTDETLNDGKPIYKRLVMSVSSTSAISLFAVNRSGNAFTTGAQLVVGGKLWGSWM